MKSAPITGCSKGGIGDALAQEFYRNDVRVFATAGNMVKVEHLKVLGIEVLQLDVLSPEYIQVAAAEVLKATAGELDFLFNNAGGGEPCLYCCHSGRACWLDTDLKTAREEYDLNVFSVLAVTQAFAPSLIDAKGKVINVGSIVGRTAQAYTGIYNTSKAALNLLSETHRLELAPFDVEVITVVAGVVKTHIFASQGLIEFPKDSLYLTVQKNINKAAIRKEAAKSSMEPSVFAAGVVSNALKAKSESWFWRGGNARLVWFVTTFFGHTFPHSLFYKSSGLNRLERHGSLKA